MLFQVGIGSLGGTVFFRWDFVPLRELCSIGITISTKTDSSLHAL